MNLQNLRDIAKIYDLHDPLDGVVLPAPLDAEACKSAIMMRCGLLEPIYSDPNVFYEMCASWFSMRQWNFEHLIKIIQAEYSPIENTDRYSEHEITTTGTDTRNQNGSEGREIARTRTPDLTDKTVNEISAENSSFYQPDSQYTETHSGVERDQTNEDVTRSSEEALSREGAEKYVEHTHGNIGVTTNTQLITEELDLMRRFNVYEWIAARLESDFFIQIY